MKLYHDFLRHTLTFGHRKSDRTGTGTISTFGYQMRFDLREGFPLVTTKKIHLKSVIHELLWFLQGSTNVKYLQDNGVTIWDEWACQEDVYEDVTLSVKERLALLSEKTQQNSAVVEAYIRERVTTRMNKEHGTNHELHLSLDVASTEARGRFDLELDLMEIPRTEKRLIKQKGDLGRVYGAQWRDWIGPNGQHIDQIQKLIQKLKNNPDDRRIIVSAWNVGEIEDMALPPCHAFFQFYSRELTPEEILNANISDSDIIAANYDGDHDYNWREGVKAVAVRKGLKTRALSCQLYQRSCDEFLGVPFNIASYALLVMMVAQVTNHAVGEFVWTGGDCHIYDNHMDQVQEQLGREPRALPRMVLNPDVKDIFDFKYEDFTLHGYDPHPAIKAPVAI